VEKEADDVKIPPGGMSGERVVFDVMLCGTVTRDDRGGTLRSAGIDAEEDPCR
jgi:hypothetical protein